MSIYVIPLQKSAHGGVARSSGAKVSGARMGRWEIPSIAYPSPPRVAAETDHAPLLK
jgi:hypothetical protein